MDNSHGSDSVEHCFESVKHPREMEIIILKAHEWYNRLIRELQFEHVSAEMCTEILRISFSGTLQEEPSFVLLTVLTCNSRSQDMKIEIIHAEEVFMQFTRNGERLFV